MSVDLVISAYRDSLDWIQPLLSYKSRPRIFVYDKGDHTEVFPPRLFVGLRGSDATLISRPNRGLCDETYAHHIVTHYDDLADWTVFTPDGPHDHLPEGSSMMDAMLPDRNLKVPRLWKGRDWDPVSGRLNWHQWAAIPKRFGTNWKEHYESGKIARASLSFVEWTKQYIGFDVNGAAWPGYAPGGILAVPKRAITYLPRAFYERLRDQLAHAVEPEEGHYMERAWVVVFTGRARYVEEATV